MELSGWPASPPEKQMGSRSSWAPGLTQANSTHMVWTVNGVGQGPKEVDGLMDEESSAEARPSQGWHRGQAEHGGEADWLPDRVASSPGRRLCGGALGPLSQPLQALWTPSEFCFWPQALLGPLSPPSSATFPSILEPRKEAGWRQLARWEEADILEPGSWNPWFGFLYHMVPEAFPGVMNYF